MIAVAWDSIKTEILKRAWGKFLNQTLNEEHKSDTEHQDTDIQIMHQIVQNLPQFKNRYKKEVNDWLKTDEVYLGFLVINR